MTTTALHARATGASADASGQPRPAALLGTPKDGGWTVALGALVWREWQCAWRRRTDLLGGLMFFAIAASLFPIAVSPEPALLLLIGPGVLWVAALLACLLGLPRLFEQDLHDGALDALALSPYPLPLLILAKTVAHWLCTGLPLVLMAPVLAIQYGLPTTSVLVLTTTLLLGTPVLSLIGAIGAALTVGLRGAGTLLALLVLPLYVPVLVFGSAAVSAHASGLSASGHYAVLGAMLCIGLFAAPLATAAALRMALE